MRPSTYFRYELIRNFRNRRFFVFTVGFPLALYLLIATPNRHEDDLGGSRASPRRSTSWSGWPLSGR
jgi:ABC-2 type transport system permease protein